MVSKNINNGYYKLKTEDGDKWLHFSRLFISKLEEVTGKNLVEYGEHLQSVDESIDITDQFDAVTDITMAAMAAYDEKNGNDVDYDLYKVGKWLWSACETDEMVIADIITAETGKEESGQIHSSTEKRESNYQYELDEYYLGFIGIDPIKYWDYTLKQLDYMAKCREKYSEENWMRNRNVEFAIYNASINAMNGKQNFRRLKKPADLYKLPSDPKEKAITGKAAERELDKLLK